MFKKNCTKKNKNIGDSANRTARHEWGQHKNIYKNRYITRKKLISMSHDQ